MNVLNHGQVWGKAWLCHVHRMLVNLLFPSLFFFIEARDILRDFREENVRKSDVIVDLWERVLRSKNSKLGDERKRVNIWSGRVRYTRMQFLLSCRVFGFGASLHSGGWCESHWYRGWLLKGIECRVSGEFESQTSAGSQTGNGWEVSGWEEYGVIYGHR